MVFSLPVAPLCEVYIFYIFITWVVCVSLEPIHAYALIFCARKNEYMPGHQIFKISNFECKFENLIVGLHIPYAYDRI